MAKILVADDNSNVQKTVALALVNLGVEVVSVNNGEAAVRKLSTFSPDLILADIFMPVRNGYEVCEYVKKDPRFGNVPVVLLVGAFDPLDEREAQRVGADGILKKPFVPPDPLITMVKTLLDRTASERLVGVAASKPAVSAQATSADTKAPAISASLPEVAEESSTQEFPSPMERVEFSEGQHPVAFGTLLETPEEPAVVQKAPAIEPAVIEPVDDEQILTSSRDATLGDPVFWKSDAEGSEADSEADQEPADEVAAGSDSSAFSWNHQGDSEARSEESVLLEPVEPFELVHEELVEASPSVADPVSILLDQASQAALTVESQKADDLVANPMEWISTAPEFASQTPEVAPETEAPVSGETPVVDDVVEPADPLEHASVSQAADSASVEVPASAEVLNPLRVPVLEKPVIPVAAEVPAPAASAAALPEPPSRVHQDGDVTLNPDAQSAEDTAHSIPLEKWADLTSSIQEAATEAVSHPMESKSSTPAETSIAPVVGTEASVASPATQATPDPALVEAVVQRVLDKMRPQVVDIITKEFLRPIVQALVHREIEKH